MIYYYYYYFEVSVFKFKMWLLVVRCLFLEAGAPVLQQ